jgi:hypothetical protein
MAKPRITITVSEEAYEFLSEWAEREQQPLANLAAYLLNKATQEYQKKHQTTSSPTRKQKDE